MSDIQPSTKRQLLTQAGEAKLDARRWLEDPDDAAAVSSMVFYSPRERWLGLAILRQPTITDKARIGLGQSPDGSKTTTGGRR